MKNVLTKMYYHSLYSRYFLYTLLYAVLTPFTIFGLLLIWVAKPFVALGHLLLGNFETAKDEITNWIPAKSIRDIF